jgi:hypothetical protein
MNAVRTNTPKHVSARRGIASDKGREVRKRFDGKVFEALADDLKSGRIPLDRVVVSDDRTTGLRAIIRNTGAISFHVQYLSEDGSRPYILMGHYPDTTVDRARERARTIHTLAAKGIDPTAGLHARLLKELDRDGVRWKP